MCIGAFVREEIAVFFSAQVWELGMHKDHSWVSCYESFPLSLDVWDLRVSGRKICTEHVQ